MFKKYFEYNQQISQFKATLDQVQMQSVHMNKQVDTQSLHDLQSPLDSLLYALNASHTSL